MAIIQRRKSYTAKIGNVMVGGNAPVMVQSMTNTDTSDVASTVQQVASLARAGSEVVRVTVNNDAAAAAVPEIVARLADEGIDVPIVGDFHFIGHTLLRKFPACARALAKYRINPGNVGGSNDDNFRAMIQCAIDNDKPVRIGVNGGSLDKDLLARMMDENLKLAAPRTPHAVMMEAMIQSALHSAELAESFGLAPDHILLSVKVSAVQDLVDLYRELGRRCQYPLHLGLTEAGMGAKGIVSSTAGLAILLQEGIGDTIRVSLTPTPGGDRTEEVKVARQILQSLDIRSFVPQITSCPGCGRTTSTYFQELALEIQTYIDEKMPAWSKQYAGIEELKLAVMGCVVNGPGESKHANIGISLPGTSEEPKAPVFIDGEKVMMLKGNHIAEEFKSILDGYVEKKYAKKM